MITGLMGVSEMKAPFLKGSRLTPLVAVPSGKMPSGLLFVPAITYSWRSRMASSVYLVESFLSR